MLFLTLHSHMIISDSKKQFDKFSIKDFDVSFTIKFIIHSSQSGEESETRFERKVRNEK